MSELESIVDKLLEYSKTIASKNISDLDSRDAKKLELIYENLSVFQSNSIDVSDKKNKIIKEVTANSIVKQLNFSLENEIPSAFSKVFFNSIINSLNDAIWSSSIDYSFVFFVNPAFEKLTGYSKIEVIDNPSLIVSIIHPEDKIIYTNALIFFNKYGYCHSQYRIITKSNEIKWVQSKELLIKDEEGNSVRIDGVKSDITESKLAIEKELSRASNLLIQQENLLKLSCLGSEFSFDEKLKKIMKETSILTNTERVSIWVFEKKRSLLTSKCIYQLSMDEFLPSMNLYQKDYPNYFKIQNDIVQMKSLMINDVYNDPFANEILEDYLKPIGVSSMLVVPIMKKNELFGVVSLSHVGAKRLWSQEENVFITSISSIISVCYESEEKRLLELALIERSRILLEAQNVARIGNYIIDLVTGTWKSSAVFDQIFGIRKNYLKDVKNWIKLISPDHSGNVFNVFKEVLKEKKLNNKKRFDVSFKIIRQNDSAERWVTVLGEFQFDENGVPTHMLGTMQDITDRKYTEEALIKAKEEAEELLSIKQNFLSNMSHEIRTPLNAIVGFTRYLKESKLDKDQMEMMQAIDFSGKNLLVIVNDILDFSKIDANKMVFEKTDFSLAHSLKNTLNLMQIKAEEKKLSLFYRIDPKIEDKLIGDPTRLNQILINLVGNAIKFTEKGSVKVESKLINENKEFIEIIFNVTDSGIGIEADKIDSIFESFNQASNDTTRKYGGSGLGLTITKKIIELQGGTINVQSKIGKGSKFSFSLTYKKQDLDKKKVDVILPKEEINHNFLVTQNILMVEDLLINQLLAKKIFNKWNCQLDFAVNGKNAIEKIKESDYDIILMDLQMPEMDGYETAKYIREFMGSKSRTPIIALSAHANNSEKEKCLKVGMNAFVPKPIEEDVLLQEMFIWHNQSKKNDVYLKKREEEPVRLKKEHINTGIINFHYLDKVTNGDSVFIRELVEIVSVELPKSLKIITNLFSSKDADKLKKEIHKVKASITIFGVSRGQELIYEIESSIANDHSVEGLKPKLDEFFSICKVLLSELQLLK